MYTVILDASHAGTSYHDAPGASHVVDGFIGSLSQQPQHRPTPPVVPPQPRNTASVSYQNQTPEYARMMSQSGATTSYVHPAPPQQAQAMAWPTQQYAGKITTFLALPPTQIYYAPPIQEFQSPTPASPTSLGQVFAQQNHPNQPTPKNQQGKARNNRPHNQGNNQP